MRRTVIALVALALVAAACSTSGGTATTTTGPATGSTLPEATTDDEPRPTEPTVSYAGTDPAPEFPPGLDWLNVDAPLTLEGLRGKAVLLDFWTYGCINCIHIIPDLKRLEAEFADELVVIGVHSAKFLNEGETENIRNVILRYEVEHPVVNDRDFVVWRTWGANAWPTVVLIDPAGNIVGGHAGEGVYPTVQPVIQALIQEFDAQGLVDRTPFELALEPQSETLLSFPGKVLAEPDGDRLFVADSGNHRIVVVQRTTGDVLAVYGAGTEGLRNGPALQAAFSSPQGMELSADGSTLFVADTNNHVIRAIDLDSGEVSTYAGTGRQGWPPATGQLTETSLASPWDLVRRGDQLYIAMAGTHQIWAADLAAGTVGPVVGNARESVRNGPIAEAELAQPSGLAFDDSGRLYFADSESSSIRYADVEKPDGRTGVVSGTDQNLFDFGDVDGVGTEARLQHPLGVVFWEDQNALLIADTYNSKIKRIDLADNATATFAGSTQGWQDGAMPSFYEPGGIDLADGLLYIADTNNHVIRVLDLETGIAETLVIKGIEAFNPPPGAADYRGTVVDLGAAEVSAGAGQLVLDVALPTGYRVNEEAPSSIVWTVDGEALSTPQDRDLTGTDFPIAIDVEFTDGSAGLIADLVVVYCREEAASLCFIQQVRFVADVTVGADGPDQITLAYTIDVPA